jgi:hypothetical protein
MVAGFEISDNLDWTAIGTMVLALVTSAGLLFGWRSLRQGQTEVEEAHRPVLAPVADSRHVRIARGTDLPARPTVPVNGLLVIPVENIGSGPALSVRVALFPLKPGEWSATWSGQNPVGIIPTAIGVVQGVTPLEIELPDVREVPGFELDLSYEDVAGKEWRTFTRWIPTSSRYDPLKLEEQQRKSRGKRMWESLRRFRSS